MGGTVVTWLGLTEAAVELSAFFHLVGLEFLGQSMRLELERGATWGAAFVARPWLLLVAGLALAALIRGWLVPRIRTLRVDSPEAWRLATTFVGAAFASPFLLPWGTPVVRYAVAAVGGVVVTGLWARGRAPHFRQRR